MNPQLYLDMARIGQMSTSAVEAISAVVQMAQADPKQIFDSVVRQGKLDDDETKIPHWRGISGLESSIRRCVSCEERDLILAASSSANLMKVAARSLFLVSRRVLTTDLAWPRYRQILRDEAIRTKQELIVCKLRRELSEPGLGVDDLVDRVASRFVESQCDGLFLTGVSSDGYKLPVSQIVEAIELKGNLRYVVVDGAQEVGHCESNLVKNPSDIYLFGTHKWLGSYFPLSLAVYGKRRSKDFVETTVQGMLNRSEIEDSLLSFMFRFRRDQVLVNETVNFVPLVAASGALSRKENNSGHAQQLRLHNLSVLRSQLEDSSWNIENWSISEQLRTAIVMLKKQELRDCNPKMLEDRFREHGVVLSAFPFGRVRLSMPASLLTVDQREQLSSALDNI